MCYWWPSVNARLYGPFCTNSIGVSARRTLWASCYLASIIVLGIIGKSPKNSHFTFTIWVKNQQDIWMILMKTHWDILGSFSTVVYLPVFWWFEVKKVQVLHSAELGVNDVSLLTGKTTLNGNSRCLACGKIRRREFSLSPLAMSCSKVASFSLLLTNSRRPPTS